MREAKYSVTMTHCYFCPWCVEKLADEKDGAFDYPDMQLYCRSVRRVIVERVRNCDVPRVEVPAWCPFVVKE
jgi:hypothetical protein